MADHALVANAASLADRAGFRDMRGIVIVVLALGALLLPAGAAGAAYCQGANRDTLAETSGVRVYRITRGEQELRVMGCLKRNGRKTWLGWHGPTDTESYFLEPIRIKGPLVAYGMRISGREHYRETTVEVVDLRTRRNLFVEGYEDARPITDIELTRGGSVAWIASVYDRYPVRKRDAPATREVDDGVGVDPTSLTRTESELRWVKNGEPRAASFR